MGSMPRNANDPDEQSYSGRVAARLKELRLSKGKDIDDLAATLGVSAKTVYQWESGRSSPQYDKLPAIAAALGCSIRQLFPAE